MLREGLQNGLDRLTRPTDSLWVPGETPEKTATFERAGITTGTER